ncbi:hypothetical protein J2W49_004718 [Hydrogenophaga palleronii]|uniref:Transmembrane protein n=1 Tax=Hydrogenophaga palleronii TaxID=65655 RepID=A0ABU1WTW5_9BURK|nr:hypothetical protein [Hydrogenophaga palleronii]MDR7152740.1 hypothetical protein [Hydrogenophaga palleronii]
MERLKPAHAWEGVTRSGGVRQIWWELRRYGRGFTGRWGRMGWINLLLILLLLSAGGYLAWQRASLIHLQRSLAELTTTRSPVLASDRASKPVELDGAHAARARMQAFDDHLLAHDAIAQAIRDLLRLAEDHGLVLEQGDYVSQADASGRFLRFRMNLPVKGPTQAIHGFVKAALLTQPQLALDGIRFKRNVDDQGVIEAQLIWVLLSELPGAHRNVSAQAADPKGRP